MGLEQHDHTAPVQELRQCQTPRLPEHLQLRIAGPHLRANQECARVVKLLGHLVGVDIASVPIAPGDAFARLDRVQYAVARATP